MTLKQERRGGDTKALAGLWLRAALQREQQYQCLAAGALALSPLFPPLWDAMRMQHPRSEALCVHLDHCACNPRTEHIAPRLRSRHCITLGTGTAPHLVQALHQVQALHHTQSPDTAPGPGPRESHDDNQTRLTGKACRDGSQEKLAGMAHRKSSQGWLTGKARRDGSQE